MSNVLAGLMNGRWAALGGLFKRRLDAGWRWWKAEIFDTLPERLRNYIEERNKRVFLLLFDRDVVVFDGSIENMKQVARFGLNNPSASAFPLPEETSEIVLLLPPDRTLMKAISLPAATEENLREVLSFEMDHETPFRPDDVYFDGVVTNRSAERRSIQVDLVLTPRDYLDRLLTTLSAVGLAPHIVAAKDGTGAMHGVNLLPADRVPPRAGNWSASNVAFGGLAFALLAVAIALPIQKKLGEIEALEPRVAAATEIAREGTEIRNKIDSLLSTTEQLVDRKYTDKSVMALLDELTRLVPDGTWIDRLDIADREIQLQGVSPSAASLIGLIEASDIFDDSRFVSPVTQLQSSALEKFHLSARWTDGQSND